MARSQLVRLLGIGALALLLQAPLLFVGELARERRGTRDAAAAEMAWAWGGAQQVAGPFLVVPYHRAGEQPGQGAATFLPVELRVAAHLETERLRRGLFETPVYRATLEIAGAFEPPSFGRWGTPADAVLWERAEVVLDVSGVRSIRPGARLRWGERELDFEPGAGLRADGRTGIHARLGASGQEGGTFTATLELAGSTSLRVASSAEVTTVEITGDWPHPSFRGAWLPEQRELDADGFSAVWRVSHLGRGYPQSWQHGAQGDAVDAAAVGVDLVSPVDPYRQSARAVKYSLLFVALTFGVAWLFEVLGGERLHPIHYALIGAAICLFYLLQLALSEHVGFAAAYAIAAAVVVLTNGAYARSLLPLGRAALLAAVLAALYAGMYVLLQLDDHALLAGAVALFLILAAIMYATRAVDWHGGGTR